MNYLAVLNGRELAELALSGYFPGLRQSRLAPDPVSAIERIVSTFGVRPSRLGTNVPGITAIREAIWAVTHDAVIANGLVIIAPHTHWSSNLPIVISANGQGYRIGPTTPLDEGRYTPVSFVFSLQGPLPYEWADDSIAFGQADLERMWRAIGDICEALASHDWPLGLSLNFRSKNLFGEEPVATLEYPENADVTNEGPALISRVDEAIRSHDDSSFDQVAWHGYSDSAYSLEADEREVLAEFRRRLDGIKRLEDLQAVLQHLEREFPRR